MPRAAGPTVGQRLSAADPSRLVPASGREDLVLVGVIVLLIVFAPLFGAGLAAWTAYDRNRNGDLRMRNIALVLLVAGVALMAIPEVRYGLLWRLLG